MKIISHRKIFFVVSALLVAASIVAMIVWGFPTGTDFTGGSILEVSYVNQDRPDISEMDTKLSELSLGSFSLRPSGSSGLVLRTREISDTEKAKILGVFSQDGTLQVNEERFNAVGPIVGNSLKSKSYKAIIVVLVMILLFITFAFRKVSKPVSSWKYGFAAIVALAHDVIIPTGAYILLSRFTSAEIDLLFVTALLAILGFSVHDTIVVFDRVRENLQHNRETNSKETFEETVGRGLMETMTRSINTSLTVILSLVVLYFLGSEATRNFVFVLVVGIIAGVYSSIFLASPLLVVLAGKRK
ncbi:MAG: protein-export membrane protein SecF [Candidatus Zambryskibacteria bacterium RIFCSPHIGHO2_12_FULL_44_12b]|uniref:Protein-export membrane protein SecF n=1 Tax=Candidatus Zambryskibacteria bacterium RIFCSPLOWO2_01_FULL_45_21 TaxID=1802761 RepID=A0A1G2U0D1_9BACT|nr:MAG: protein-export membrane protein SecF [Candidatus Zambryskibacteria bacterium RIFCSPHIGHO2_12_FULL_44_12b]OHB02849.1 MAG: protein-export membrane protein SecF [Candidatus Zambryskibacteria bacterium RIFCSPLOWO2_01_FULL_45_21]